MMPSDSQEAASGLLGGKVSRRAFIRHALAAGLSVSAAGTLLAACGNREGGAGQTTPTSAGESPQPRAQTGEGTANLLFTFWGSPNEKDAVNAVAAKFSEEHPDIQVTAQHVAGDYATKITTMLASGQPPDLGYLGGDLTLQWGDQGKLLELNSYFMNDPFLKDVTEFSLYKVGDQIIASNTANEFNLIFYNKDLFDEAGMKYPPATADQAWTWDQFLEVAKKLTKDTSGNDATSSKFDPHNIQTYGIYPLGGFEPYASLVYSNGGRFVNDDGTKLLVNEPATVDVLQKVQDLMYKYHVAPTSTVTETFPSANIMMQSRKVAMEFGGQWEVLDFSRTKGLNWGMGVLPKFKQPRITIFGGATVIFKATKYPDQAIEFMKYLMDPEKNDLFKEGLWMPLQQKYYTDPTWTSKWLEGKQGVYPPEAKELFQADYVLESSLQPIGYWVKNMTEIGNKALNPSFELLWTGQASAQEAMDMAVKKSQGLMQGTWAPPPAMEMSSGES